MKSLRCKLGFHRWVRIQIRRSETWRCDRCFCKPPKCRNCDGVHDPNAMVVVCSVTRSWS